MKTKKLILALSGIALLASCGPNPSDGGSSEMTSSSEASSSFSSESSLDDSSSSSQNPVSISDKVYEVLDEMKKGNYSLSYVLGDKELTDIVTPSYCYTGYLNSGSILLKTYEDQPLSYDFTLNQGKLEVRGQSFNEDYSGQIQELQSRLKELKNQAAGSVQTITAPASGLYSAVVDGYESVLTPESLTDMTPSKLNTVRADSAVSSGVGKLILGDSWYYAAVMSTADAKELKAEADALQGSGKSLILRFAKNVERDLPVTLSHIGAEENGRCVVVFEGKTYLSQLTLLRQQGAQVIWDSAEGIRVPKEALRIDTRTTENEDGTTTESRVTGVYCVVGMEARFKPVEVLYNGSSFLLVRANAPSDKEKLRLRPGDEVIITANDLYDGKVIGQKNTY